MSRPNKDQDGKTWLPLVRASGEEDLGRSIVRLARLAEAAHRFEAADFSAPDTDLDTEDLQRTNGLVGGSVVPVPRRGTVHREVDQ